jgi:hypothetical protein
MPNSRRTTLIRAFSPTAGGGLRGTAIVAGIALPLTYRGTSQFDARRAAGMESKADLRFLSSRGASQASSVLLPNSLPSASEPGPWRHHPLCN